MPEANKAEVFIKLAQSVQYESLGITWSTIEPLNVIDQVEQRSVGWSAGLIAGMQLVGVKILGERNFETPKNNGRPNLDAPGLFPRVLVLKCRYGGCLDEEVKKSRRVRARAGELKAKVEAKLGPCSKVDFQIELQRTLMQEHWTTRVPRTLDSNACPRFFDAATSTRTHVELEVGTNGSLHAESFETEAKALVADTSDAGTMVTKRKRAALDLSSSGGHPCGDVRMTRARVKHTSMN
ncbi:Aste57867_23456 [Aphanomyces stellatus]|uniref:Aste57867_23456 protein n=1 Tax=Aphanomyces stellatus TaxID=120398 RepID=A0A485LNK5_9STRA|nr:hypothetical protein As57867_023385 [Aphanomyces stellatus]VFU00102.1 Aste57867_23456 [Aphanomyces stellatus]